MVDDNDINRRVLQRQLQAAGGAHIEVVTAENGREAVDIVRAQPDLDLVFMDIEMPVMGGLEATGLIRNHERELARAPVPILGLSGNARQVRSRPR